MVLVDSSSLDWLKALVAVWVVAVMASSFGLDNARSWGPAWSTGVRQAQATCRLHPDQAQVGIAVSPAPWRAPIPCSRLR